MNLSETVLNEADRLFEYVREIRRFLHKNAEVGFDLEKTVSFVRSELEKIGIDVKNCGRAGLVATIGGKKKGKTFLLRADMDALPINEETDLEFCAENGCMHACGHDFHTAMLIGAARLLKIHEEEIEGTVKLMFQPAEEIFEGSEDMIKSGLLENPHVDAGFMLHVMAGMPFEAGTAVISPSGVSAPAADLFEIKVNGIGCHGSMPNVGVDPINAAAHIAIALQEIHSRELAISERAVLTIGSFHGGTAPNAIADSVIMGGSIRSFDEDVRAFLKKRLTQISELTAETFRATAEVTFRSGCPTLKNDSDLVLDSERFAMELFGEKRVFSAERLSRFANDGGKTAGSEDFAYVSQKIPTVMVVLAAGKPDQGYTAPQHHPKVKFDEAVLPYGTALYAYTALRWLLENK